MKIKTKIIALFLCVFSVAAAFTFGGCSGCSLSAKPTKSKVCDIVSGTYGITLPESIKLINYATEVGFDGGIWYCVFDYDGSDEKFNSLLSDKKDADFENNFKAKYNHAKNYFNKDYESPDLTKEYKWIYASATSSTGRRAYELLILYFENENQLVVIDDTIQVYN